MREREEKKEKIKESKRKSWDEKKTMKDYVYLGKRWVFVEGYGKRSLPPVLSQVYHKTDYK
jgi:hypothetical protein